MPKRRKGQADSGGVSLGVRRVSFILEHERYLIVKTNSFSLYLLIVTPKMLMSMALCL